MPKYSSPPPPSLSTTNTINLSFLPNQPVGIHFKFLRGYFTVTGFTANSPANKLSLGRILNYRMTMLNGINLTGVTQAVCVTMMKEVGSEHRTITFVGEKKLPVVEHDLANAHTRTQGSFQGAARGDARAGDTTRTVNVATNKGGGRGAGSSPAPAPTPAPINPHRGRTDSRSDPRSELQTSTPARLRRIIYDVCRDIYAGYKVKAIEGAIDHIRKTKAAIIIQRYARGWLGRRFLDYLIRKNRYLKARTIQCRYRQYRATRRRTRLHFRRLADMQEAAAVRIQQNWRRLQAMNRLKLRMARIAEMAAMNEKKRKQRKVVIMQAAARRAPARSRYKLALAATLKIQTLVRLFLCRDVILKIRQQEYAATLMQTAQRRLNGGKERRRRKDAVDILNRAAAKWLLCRAARSALEAKREEFALEMKEMKEAEGVRALAVEEEKQREIEEEEEREQELEDELILKNVAGDFSPSPSTASPAKESFQLRFSPQTGSGGHSNELFGLEDAKDGNNVETPPPSPEKLDMEVFRRDREEREGREKEQVAQLLQKRMRGRSARVRVTAMKRVGANLGRLRYEQKCREVVRLLVERRRVNVSVIQRCVRGKLATLTVAKRRLERYELVMGLYEKEFGEGLLGLGGGELDVVWREEEEEEGGAVGGGEEGETMRRKWMRVMEKTRPPKGCELFRDGVAAEMYEPMLDLVFS